MQVAELRAARRRDRRALRDLQRQIVVLREQIEQARALPVVVREPPAAEAATQPASPAGADGESAAVAYADDGVEVLYVGEAAEDRSVRPRISLREERGRDRYEPPTESLAPVPAAGERLIVTEGAVPPISAADRGAGAVPRPAAKAPDRGPGPKELYQQYYRALRAGDHAAAIAGFRAFIDAYPTHDYADNAQYWLAEAYYDQRQYDRALVEFRAVATRFPKGNKVPDALLKVAYCLERLGRTGEARAALERVIADYAHSNAAALAADRLAQLREQK